MLQFFGQHPLPVKGPWQALLIGTPFPGVSGGPDLLQPGFLRREGFSHLPVDLPGQLLVGPHDTHYRYEKTDKHQIL